MQNSTCSVIRKGKGVIVVSTERDRQQVSCIQNAKLSLSLSLLVLHYGSRFTVATALGGMDALRTRLNLGLHHLPLLRRGRCNPIPAREPVEEKHQRGQGPALLSPHSTPSPSQSLSLPLSLSPCMFSFLILVGIFPSYPTVVGRGQLVEWAADSEDLICYRSTYGEYVVELSTLDSPLCTSVLWRDRACPDQSRCRIYLKVRSVRVVREYPPGRPIWATAIYSEGNQPHRITTMGFYGTLKMIFYKVSRIVESHFWQFVIHFRPSLTFLKM